MSQLVETEANGAADDTATAPVLSQRRGWTLGVGRERASLIGLWLGVAVLAVPTLIENIQQNWSLDQSAEGPIIFAIGLWLLFRRWPAMLAAGAPPLGAGARVLILGLWVANSFIYVLGRVGGQYILETYALYGFLLIGIYATLGAKGLRAGGFSLVFLVFALPVPFFINHALTTHLRLGLTQLVVQLFQSFGLDIEKDGLTIMIDQYQLAVEDACSGMNSLFTLSAMGLVYIYLRRPGRPLYLGLMMVPIIGFAMLSNFVRIAVLVLITHLYGDAVAQSLLHEATGFVTFATALGGLFVLDALIAPWLPRSKHQANPSKHEAKPGRSTMSPLHP